MLSKANRADTEGHGRSAARQLPRAVTLCMRLVLALLLAWTAACGNLAGPDYKRPETPRKAAWSDDSTDGVSAAETIRPDWWRNFDDAYLDRLMAQAISNNYDLQVLAARAGVAEAAIDQANAARLPTVDASLGARLQGAQGQGTNHAYSQSEAIGWEIDIWGKLKKGVQAQEADFNASEADWRAGYLMLAAELSSTWTIWAGLPANSIFVPWSNPPPRTVTTSPPAGRASVGVTAASTRP